MNLWSRGLIIPCARALAGHGNHFCHLSKWEEQVSGARIWSEYRDLRAIWF